MSEHLELYRQIPHPFRLGMRFLGGAHVYQIVRMTDKRAYVERQNAVPLWHTTKASFNSGVLIHGNEHKNGLYIELGYWSQSRQNEFVEVSYRDLDDLEQRVECVNRYTLKHLDRIRELEDAIALEKDTIKQLVVSGMKGDE